MNKKKIFVLALAVCLIGILSVGTLAWFTAEDRAENKFLIAGSEDDEPNDIFSVDVWEVIDENGTKVGVGPDVIATKTYEDILPGDKWVKEPHIENTGAYDQYIRVTVTLSDLSAWEAAGLVDIDAEEVFVGFDATMWENVTRTEDAAADTITYVLYYADKLAVGADITVFTHIAIPTSLTAAQAVAFDDDGEAGFDIDVYAEAVQTRNVGDTALEAFTTVGLA